MSRLRRWIKRLPRRDQQRIAADANTTLYCDMVRNSLKYVAWKDYKAVTAGLKTIYQSITEELGVQALDKFAEQWNEQYP